MNTKSNTLREHEDEGTRLDRYGEKAERQACMQTEPSNGQNAFPHGRITDNKREHAHWD